MDSSPTLQATDSRDDPGLSANRNAGRDAAIVAAVRAGGNVASIAKEHGVTRQRIFQIAKRAGIIRRPVALSTTKPWKALGISRTTYYRRRARSANGAPPARRGRGPKHAIRTRFELPIPPSTNALWFNLPNGKGRAKTKAYCAWLTAAGWELKAQHARSVPGRFVYLEVSAGLTKRERDLDNILKAIGDLLQAHGIVENDRAIVEIRALWDRTVPDGRVRVEVRQTRGPRQRMTTEGRARLSALRRGVPLSARYAHLIAAAQ